MSHPVLNLPCPEGEALGRELARLTDAKAEAFYKQFPNAAERCKSCAFRLGTVPNRCLVTVAEALRCALGDGTEAFYCHEHMVDGEPTKMCAGYGIAIARL